jgi:predicted metal-dependent hydrolase
MSNKPANPLRYLGGYAPDLLRQVSTLIDNGKLGELLIQRYPHTHDVRTDRALYDYVTDLKNKHIRNGSLINKVTFDSKIQVVAHALGQHATISRVQGQRLKAKHEIRIATIFRATPPEFLKMITVHELAHLKESEHNKAFYQLCLRMEPDYHQHEFDMRLYLTYLALPNSRALWPGTR